MAFSRNNYISLQEVATAVEKCLFKVDINMKIKPKQLDALVHILRGQDTLCVLPTAGGKSLIYQLLPAVIKSMSRNVGGCSSPIVIIVSPLISLIKDQVKEANEKKGLELAAVYLESDRQDINDKNLIFATPEMWLDNKGYRDMLSSKHFVKNLKCIVVDEVHKVKWYVHVAPGCFILLS